jgi:hypothetical protein
MVVCSPSMTETGFRIERSPDGSAGWRQIGTVAAGVTAYTHAGQPALTTYFYRVRATSAGDSSYSNIASATTLGNRIAAGEQAARGEPIAGQSADDQRSTSGRPASRTPLAPTLLAGEPVRHV